VRAQFALTDDFIHMAAMLISSHPKPVRDAIDEYRRAIDANPLTYLFQNNRSLQDEARSSSGAARAEDRFDVDLVAWSAQQHAACQVAENRREGIWDRSNDSVGLCFRIQSKPAVHARDQEIERAQHLVRVVEEAVLEDVRLDPFEEF